MLGAAGVLLAAGLLAAPSSLLALRDARAAQRALDNALEAVGEREADDAQSSLEEARERLRSAGGRLGSVWTQPARLVPLAGRQFIAADRIVSSAEGLASFAAASLEAVRAQPGGSFALRGGALDVDALRTAGEILTEAAPVADMAVEAIDSSPKTWLLPPLRSAREDAHRTITEAAGLVRKGAAGLQAAPSLLGADGVRRYLVLNSNLSELRGTGGILSYYALVEAEAGRLSVDPEPGRTGTLPRPSEIGVQPPDWYVDTWGRYEPLDTWQNVNMTVDFPTAADIMGHMATAEHGPIHGVVQIDPFGLGALLALAGPVDVPGWPVPVTSDNIANIAQNEMYMRYENPEDRDTFAERLIGLVFARALTSDLELSLSELEGLGEAVGGGHIKVYSTDPAAQEALGAADIDGRLRMGGATDAFGVFAQNAGAGKGDWYVKRTVDYDVLLDEARTVAEITARIELKNEMPADGLPQYILGDPEVAPPGTNTSIVALVRPERSILGPVTLDGQETPLSIDREAGNLLVHQLRVVTPSMATSVVEATFLLPLLEPLGNTYDIKLFRQPVVTPDTYRVSTGGNGVTELELEQTTVVSLSPVQPRAWDRFLLDPLRRLGRLVNPFD